MSYLISNTLIIAKPIEQKKIMNGEISNKTKWSDNKFTDVHMAVEGNILKIQNSTWEIQP